jgi:hypothetical protein
VQASTARAAWSWRRMIAGHGVDGKCYVDRSWQVSYRPLVTLWEVRPPNLLPRTPVAPSECTSRRLTFPVFLTWFHEAWIEIGVVFHNGFHEI